MCVQGLDEWVMKAKKIRVEAQAALLMYSEI